MMKIKITLRLFIKKNQSWFCLARKKEVNLFMTNTVFPLVSAHGAYLILELLSVALISK